MKNIVNKFINQLLAQGNYASNTCKSYKRDLYNWLIFCNNNSITNWQGLTTKKINLFVMQKHNKNISITTIRRHLSALRAFFEYLLSIELITTNYAKNITTPKLAKKLPNIISHSKIIKLLETKHNDFLTIRNKTIIEVFYATAIRLSELIAIDIADVDIDNGFIKIFGKGAIQRYTPIGKDSINSIMKYLAIRVNFNNKALFISQKNTRLSARMVQYIVQNKALSSGIDQHIHPHMLRHSSATHFLQSSHDLSAVQKFLGHKSIKSTQCYTHLDFLELAKTYDKYHPRAKK